MKALRSLTVSSDGESTDGQEVLYVVMGREIGHNHSGKRFDNLVKLNFITQSHSWE